MQQPSQHPRCIASIPAGLYCGLAVGFLWWAVINTSLALPDGGVYSSVHGPFPTVEKCLAFTRLFVSTYDDRASGAPIGGAFCVDPHKRKVMKR